MTEQELREQFENEVQSHHIVIKNKDFPHIYIDEKVNMKWIYFKKGYSLAQETIEKQKKEIEIYKGFSKLNSMNLSLLKQIKTKDKAIAEAREIFKRNMVDDEFWNKKEAWLESNK